MQKETFSQNSQDQQILIQDQAFIQTTVDEASIIKFNKSTVINLHQDIYFILKKFQRENLQKFKDQAYISFRTANALNCDYNDQNTLKDIKNFIRKLVNQQFTENELQGRKSMIKCQSLKQMLQKQKSYLYYIGNRICLYCKSNNRNDLLQKKKLILANYYNQVPYNKKPKFSKTQKQIFKNMFTHLKNFNKIYKNQILSIEHMFSREKPNLSFLIKSKKKVQLKEILEQIEKEISSCGCVVFLISNPDQTQSNQIEQFTSKFYRDKNTKQTYLLVAFRLKKTIASNIFYYVDNLRKKHNFQVKGMRYFKSLIKQSIETLKQKFLQDCFRVKLFPQKSPYSLCVENNINEFDKDIYQTLIEVSLTGVYKKQKISVKQGTPQKNGKTKSLICEINEQLAQIKQKSGSKYKRIQIKCAQQFLNLYNQIQEEQIDSGFIKFPYNILTMQNFTIYNDQVQPIEIEKAYNQQSQFIIGKLKSNSFTNNQNKIYSIKPLFLLKLINDK